MSPLFNTINNSGYDFFFLVVDKFLDIKIPELKNFYTIYDPNLSKKNSGFLLSLKSTQNFIEETTKRSGHQAAIIPFKPSAKTDLICRRKNWQLIANPAPLNRLLEDKIKFYERCQNEKIPTIPTIIDNFSSESYTKSLDKFKTPLVIQTHFGWAGNSSYLSNTYSDIQNKIPSGTLVKYSPFLSGYSLINNCCLTKNGLIQSPVGLQYTGLPSLTSNPLATVGRQWPSLAPTIIQNQIKQITEHFGKILQRLNYHGFFGLDFFVSQDQVYLLECNPRLTASFAFYTQMETKSNLTPLFLYHIAEFINLKTDIEDHFNSNLIGSEITLKNEAGTTVKKYNDFVTFSPTYDPVSIPEEIISQLK